MPEIAKNTEELVLAGFDDLLARVLATISKKHRSPTSNRTKGSHHKAAKTRLRVTVGKQVISSGNAKKDFATAVELMDLERVSQRGIHLCRVPLVSRYPATGYQGKSQICKGEWYITTHASNMEKKHKLEEIGAALGIPVNVEIYP